MISRLFPLMVVFLALAASGQDWQDCKPDGDYSFKDVMALATSWVATSMTLDLLKQDIRQGFMLSPVIVQYSLVGLLCFEAFFSAVSAARATLRP